MATGPDGRSWQTRTRVTEHPPSVGGGYVLVRHPCGWTALDLEDGDVVRTGDGEAVGVAGGFVYTVDDDGETVRGDRVEEGAGTGELAGSQLTMPGRQLQAYVVGEHLYVLPREDGPVSLTQYAGGGDSRWDATLPVLREPTLTPVGQVLVVTSSDGSVYGIDLSTGTVRWRALAPTVAASSLLRVRARGSQAVVTVREGAADAPATVTVLDAATGRPLDRTAAPDPDVPALEATGDGWRVTVESDALPHVMEG